MEMIVGPTREERKTYEKMHGWTERGTISNIMDCQRTTVLHGGMPIYVIVGISTQDKSGNKMAMKKKNIMFIM